jgi:hypothetical protein
MQSGIRQQERERINMVSTTCGRKETMTQIEVEDFGAELAEAIITMSQAVQKAPLTNRALALLLKDMTGISLTDCLTIVEALPRLAAHYTKK